MAIPGPLKQRDGFLWVCDAQQSHDGRETVCEGFPTGMSRIGPLPDGKLSAKVSCGIVTQ